MKVTIDIPKEFEEHWKDDRFEDSLSRLKADIHCLAGNYEKEVVDMLIVAFKNATEVVQCEDCKHFDGQECCERLCFFVGLDLSFFCKKGERREDET